MSNEPRKPTDDRPPEDWVGLARRPDIPWRTERRFYDLPRKWWMVVETGEVIDRVYLVEMTCQDTIPALRRKLLSLLPEKIPWNQETGTFEENRIYVYNRCLLASGSQLCFHAAYTSTSGKRHEEKRDQ